jgi:mono/diheme cytochrome c family protein
MKPKYLLTILPLIAALTGCGQNEVKISGSEDAKLAGTQLTATPAQLVVYPNDRPSIPDGKPVFAQSCAQCHGSDGAGGTAGVKFDQTWARQVKPVDIYRLAAFGYVEGHPKFFDKDHAHPSFSGKLSTRELWDVVVYSRSLGQPALTDTEVAAVDPVFGSNCAVCHGTKGDGDGPLARGLDPMPANFQRFDRFYNRTDDVLFDHIANGIRWEGMPNFLGKQDRKKEVKFDEPYIRKLVQYVHKFHVNSAPVLTATSAINASSVAPGTQPVEAQQSKPIPGISPKNAAKPGKSPSTTTSTTTSTAPSTSTSTATSTSTPDNKKPTNTVAPGER